MFYQTSFDKKGFLGWISGVKFGRAARLPL
jgi:hypothetical protein